MPKNYLRRKVARQPLPQSVSFPKDTPTAVFEQLLSTVYETGAGYVVSAYEDDRKMLSYKDRIVIAVVKAINDRIQKEVAL